MKTAQEFAFVDNSVKPKMCWVRPLAAIGVLKLRNSRKAAKKHKAQVRTPSQCYPPTSCSSCSIPICCIRIHLSEIRLDCLSRSHGVHGVSWICCFSLCPCASVRDILVAASGRAVPFSVFRSSRKVRREAALSLFLDVDGLRTSTAEGRNFVAALCD